MPQRKSYGQFCALARSLDHIGDRWTLLVVRELLLGPQTFRDLQATLAGISPALLSDRLSGLVEDDLVERSPAPVRSKAVEYRLNAAGRALEPVVLELIKWGTRWMVQGPGTDRAEPAWAPLALRALLADQSASTDGTVHLDVSGCPVTIAARDGGRSVVGGHHGRADAALALDLATALAVASGEVRLTDVGAAVAGRRRTAAALLQPTARRVER